MFKDRKEITAGNVEVALQLASFNRNRLHNEVSSISM